MLELQVTFQTKLILKNTKKLNMENVVSFKEH